MQISQNQKMFCEFFFAFPKSTWNLEYFEKEDKAQSWFLCEIIDCKKRGPKFQISKSPNFNLHDQTQKVQKVGNI